MCLSNKKKKSFQETFLEEETLCKILNEEKLKFLRRKQFKGKTSKLCFVCRWPGHFAKNCPKKEKAVKLLEQAQIHADDTPLSDVESLFSLDDDYSPQALVVMAYSTSEEDLDSDNEDDRSRNPNHLYILAYYCPSNQPHPHSPSTYPLRHLL